MATGSDGADACAGRLPALCAGNGGYIGSLANIVGLPFSGLYCASKFARDGMSESLRLETRPFGIHVVLVEPSDFRTQITAKRCVAEASQNSAYRTAFDKDLYEREFKFVRRHEHRIAIVEPDSASALFVDAAFGGFPSFGPLEKNCLRYCRIETIICPPRPPIAILIVAHLSSRLPRYSQLTNRVKNSF